MSALPEALAFSIAAAIYPPAILVLILLLASDRPRRLVFAYFGGAAIVTVTVGVAGLFVLEGVGATEPQSRTTSAALDVAAGVVLILVGLYAWRHRARLQERARQRSRRDGDGGRIKQWSQKATASPRWAFALGLVMYLPSPLYLFAIKLVADSGDGKGEEIPVILLCAACVLLFVEIPALALVLWPEGLAARLEQFRSWMARNGWGLAASLAVAAGAFAVVRGIVEAG